MLKCLLLRKNNPNLFDYVDYQNAGPNWIFWVFSRTLVIDVCDVRVCYRLMAVVVKAMHKTSTHNILLESLLSDV